MSESGSLRWSIESTPADGASDVERARPLRIRLDRRILPRSVRAAVRLSSGSVQPPFDLRYDLLSREIQLIFSAGTPLVAHISYWLEVDGLVDLDGFSQPDPLSVFFETGSELGESTSPPSAGDTRQALALLADRCASAGCHASPAAAAGLDLASAAGIERTAKRTSRQLELGTVRTQGASGVLWLPATRIIDVVAGRGNPATSYLMYKVLGDEHIVGEVMPPSGARLSTSELELLSSWISAAAPTQPQ